MNKGMPTNDVEVDSSMAKEPITEDTVVIVNDPAAKPLKYVDKKKKKSGGFSLFKAALVMLRGPKEKESKKKSVKKINKDSSNNANNWQNIVGSMRPLHLQETVQSPPSPHVQNISSPDHMLEDMIPTPASPAPSTSGTMSHYASAMSLRGLVDSDDEEEFDPDEVFDALTGDEMIDVKAEEFIAQFYKNIHLQNTSPIHRDDL